jgi:hypothetical protein
MEGMVDGVKMAGKAEDFLLPPSSFLLPLLPLRFPFSRDEMPLELSIESRNEAATGL